jgi:hypothetical protein
MLIDRLLQELRDLGADVRVELQPSLEGHRPDAVVKLDYEGAERRFVVEERRRAPYPAELEQLSPTRDQIGQLGTPLLVAPYVSESLGKNLIGLGWSWADAQGNFDLAATPLRLRNRTHTKRPPGRGGGFPKSAAGLRIVRGLIARPTMFGDRLSQSRLAHAAGVTQPRVSQILSGLEAEDLIKVRGRELEWDREVLWEALIDRYVGPGGVEHHLYSLDPLLDAGLEFADSAPRDAVALSADVGADLLAPARRPTHLIVYCRPGSYPAVASSTAVPVDSSTEANITVCEPADDSVFGPIGLPTLATTGKRSVRLADPTQITWDLLQLGGRDRTNAAEAMKRWMLTITR